MPGADLARQHVALQPVRPAPGTALDLEERQWNQMVREANLMASTKLVPKAMQNEPAVVLAAMLMCEAYGADRRLATQKVHYMNGELVPSAELRIGVAHARGYETYWVELSDTVATLAIRRPDQRWQNFTATIAAAERAGKLDEWVETWPQGERKKLTWKLRRAGKVYAYDTDPPAWVAGEIRGGRIKRFDSWWDYPEDMLAAAAARKAIRRAAPDALLGIDSIAVSSSGELIASPEDDEIASVSPPLAEATPAEGPPGGAAGPSATPLERQFLHTLIDALSDEQRAEARRRAKNDGLTSIDGERFSSADAERMLVIIHAVKEPKTEADDRDGTSAEDAGGGVEPPPATTLFADNDPGRPF